MILLPKYRKGKMRLVCCWAMDGIIISQWPCGTFIVHLWRNRPAFCMDVRITYEDGSVEVVSTERDWKTSSGALIFNSIYTAEHYDARLEQKGWNTVNFDDSKWNGVGYRAVPSQNVVSQQVQPIRAVETIPVKNLEET